ncbi:MAG: PQQ-like beta-propeller repeat protein [Candidatus Sumerlaeota bacterium]|nr:PQQ-like beta-propeller repeat protein [Candidatus Sumerlaeota bacterium]
MKRAFGSHVWPMILILTVLSLTALADDWPQWRGPNRDCVSLETGLMKEWPATGLSKVWEVPGGAGFSCLAVVKDRVYTIYQRDGKQRAVCLDAPTGKEVWGLDMAPYVDGMGYHGPRSTPTVEENRVYILSALGDIYCLNAADGKEIWHVETLKKFGAKNLQWADAMSPLIDGDKVLLNPGESRDASIVALNKMTGELIWKATDPAKGGAFGDMAGYSSPVIATLGGIRQYVFFLATGAAGIKADSGQVLWRIPWKTQYDVNAATPIVKDDMVFITSGYNSGCAVFKIAAAQNAQAAPAQTATQVWRNKVIRSHFGTPILYQDHLYGFDESALVCVEFATGSVKWKDGQFAKGSLVMAGGLFYVLGEKGALALVQPDSAQLKIISKYETGLSKNRCWTMPVVANGKLFARDEAKILCLDVKGK